MAREQYDDEYDDDEDRREEGPEIPPAIASPRTDDPPRAASAPSADDVRRGLEARSKGVSVTDSDVTDVLNKLWGGPTNPTKGLTGYTLDKGLEEYGAQYGRRASNTPAGSGGGGSDYADVRSHQQAAYSGSAPPQGNDRMSALIEQLMGQQAEDRKRAIEQQERTRQHVEQVMQQASQPVSINDPQFKPVVEAGRLSDQRNLDRQRAALAERLAADGLGDSGAMNTKIMGLQQSIGEQGSMREAQLMHGELNNRRQQLMQAMALASQNGNTQQAAAIQQQLAGIQTHMDQLRLGESSRQFDQDLGFRNRSFDEGMAFNRYSFDNELGFKLAALESNLNGQMFPYLF